MVTSQLRFVILGASNCTACFHCIKYVTFFASDNQDLFITSSFFSPLSFWSPQSCHRVLVISVFFIFVFHFSGPVMDLFLCESYSKGRRNAAVCRPAYNAVTGSSEWYSYLFQSHFAASVIIPSSNSTIFSYNVSNLMWHASRYVTSSYKSS